MTGSLSFEDTIATYQAVLRWAHDLLDGFAELYVGKKGITAFDVAVRLESSLRGAVDALRAAGVVPAEPAGHDTSRWEPHRSYGIRDTITGGTLWCHDANQEPSSAVRDAALAALAAVDGEAPAT